MPILMTAKTNEEVAHLYLIHSRFFLQAAYDLFHLRKQQDTPDLSFGLLLIHGLELALTAFILMKDPKETNKNIYYKYKHDYKKMYHYSVKLGDDLLSPELEKLIAILSKNFYTSSVEARFPKGIISKHFFPDNSFTILKEGLIKKVMSLFAPDVQKRSEKIFSGYLKEASFF